MLKNIFDRVQLKQESLRASIGVRIPRAKLKLLHNFGFIYFQTLA